jgi:hypothetical protein
VTLWYLPTMTCMPDAVPITAHGPDGRRYTESATWWRDRWPTQYRTPFHAAGYAIGEDADPAPHGLAQPVLDIDAEDLPVVRRAALPDPDQRTAAERIADLRAALHAELRRLRQAAGGGAGR